MRTFILLKHSSYLKTSCVFNSQNQFSFFCCLRFLVYPVVILVSVLHVLYSSEPSCTVQYSILQVLADEWQLVRYNLRIYTTVLIPYSKSSSTSTAPASTSTAPASCSTGTDSTDCRSLPPFCPAWQGSVPPAVLQFPALFPLTYRDGLCRTGPSLPSYRYCNGLLAPQQASTSSRMASTSSTGRGEVVSTSPLTACQTRVVQYTLVGTVQNIYNKPGILSVFYI